MDVIILIFLLFMHWVADFPAQTDRVAIAKSSSNKALAEHVGIYTGILVGFTILFLFITNDENLILKMPLFAAITFVAHFITDYITSRLNAKLYQAGNRHGFFVSIGFDQFLHHLQLVLTFYLLTK